MNVVLPFLLLILLLAVIFFLAPAGAPDMQ